MLELEVLRDCPEIAEAGVEHGVLADNEGHVGIFQQLGRDLLVGVVRRSKADGYAGSQRLLGDPLDPVIGHKSRKFFRQQIDISEGLDSHGAPFTLQV